MHCNYDYLGQRNIVFRTETNQIRDIIGLFDRCKGLQTTLTLITKKPADSLGFEIHAEPGLVSVSVERSESKPRSPVLNACLCVCPSVCRGTADRCWDNGKWFARCWQRRPRTLRIRFACYATASAPSMRSRPAGKYTSCRAVSLTCEKQFLHASMVQRRVLITTRALGDREL